MGAEISSIQKANSRQATETAESNDSTNNRGTLDQPKLSVFVNTKCDKNAIAAPCKEVGVENLSDDIKKELLKPIKRLEEQNNTLKLSLLGLGIVATMGVGVFREVLIAASCVFAGCLFLGGMIPTKDTREIKEELL